jgi:hypothetical protein
MSERRNADALVEGYIDELGEIYAGVMVLANCSAP